MKPGDLAILPLKTTSQVAIGKVKGGYDYHDDLDADKRHFVPVD